jgi:hypothetical protein
VPILESKVEQKASKYAESIGYLSLKINIVGQRGWPDHLFINPYGHHLWIEFKKLGEKPSKIQHYRLKQLIVCGVAAYWTDNYERAKELLDGHSMDTP